MEIIYYLSAASLILFMLLATYDGLYLHLWKYELFKREESLFEHKTHTVRAVLFPLMIWLLFINTDSFSFYVGISLLLTDLVVLAVDAYSEKDSRRFMGGLPRWEYIIHLFANGFHFSAVALLLGTRIKVSEAGLLINHSVSATDGAKLLGFIAAQAIPIATVVALLHLFLSFPTGVKAWNKIKCC